LATFWAIFPQTHLVTLSVAQADQRTGYSGMALVPFGFRVPFHINVICGFPERRVLEKFFFLEKKYKFVDNADNRFDQPIRKDVGDRRTGGKGKLTRRLLLQIYDKIKKFKLN
jgi:hypothetical protein